MCSNFPCVIVFLRNTRLDEIRYFHSTEVSLQVLGSIMSELKALGIFDDTLLVFLHDHGFAMPLFLEQVDTHVYSRLVSRPLCLS